MAQRGLWFDGQVALGRPVEVVVHSSRLKLIDADGAEHSVEPADLVRLDAPAGQSRFGHRTQEGWRLSLEEPVEPDLQSLLPAKRGSLTPGLSRRKMGILIGLSGVASALAGLVIFAPELVAAHMPLSWERRLGAAYEVPIAATRCENPRIRASLNALIDRVDPKARADGFTLEMVHVGMVNAVALPGGRMVLFDGLLDEAPNADAVAGVVAHEVAHVRRRHVASAMVRQLGLGTVVTLFGGGAVATNAGDLVSLKFSRGAESEADADAIAMLNRARISPQPTAAFFRGLAKEQGEDSSFAPEFLQSHPLSRSRAERFEAAARKDISYRPAMSDADFRALKTMCGEDG